MLLIVLLCLVSCVISGKLEIYFFDVGQGDAQLIKFPSGYTILIDGGEKSSTSMNCKNIVERIKTITGGNYIDVGVLTHLHVDHFGYPFKSGLWYILESGGLTFGKFIDRDMGSVKSNDVDCNSATEDDIDWVNVGSVSSQAAKWICYGTNTETDSQLSKIREIAKQCSTTQINPTDGKVEIIVTDAGSATETDGTSLKGDHRNDNSPPSENDYSVCLRIEFGDFVYGTCGDLDGELTESYDYQYHDIESLYKDVMGNVDLYKVNHHGSSHSNNENWINSLQPVVSVISCGTGNSYGHPREEALTNINKYSKTIYLTEDCNPDVTDNFDKTYVVGEEIIVTVEDGKDYFTVSSVNGLFTHSYNINTTKKNRESCKK